METTWKVPSPLIRNWRDLAFISLTILAAFFVYMNSVPGNFVFDDIEVIVRSDFIKSFRNVAKIFSADYFDLSAEMSYRPVVSLSYLADHALWGLNPSGFRLTNIALHAFNGALLYLLLRRILGSSSAAFLGAILFAIHPALAEAVNLPSYRDDLLSFFFYIVALLLYLRARDCRPWSRLWLFLYSAHLLSYAFALFSKEMAATLPAVAILLERAFLVSSKPRLDGRFYKWYIGQFAVLSFYILVRFFLLENPREEFLFGVSASLMQRAFAALSVIAHYLRLLFFPSNLNAFYDFSPRSMPPSISLMVLHGAIALSLLGVAFGCWRTARWFAIASAWFLIALGPVYNFAPLNVPLAERYLYLPAAAFSIFAGATLAWLSSRMWGRKLKIAASIAAALVVLNFSFLTMARNMTWRDELSLWSDTAQKSPGSAVARNNFGNAHFARAAADKAIAEYKSALWIDKKRLWVIYNLANAYLALGENRLAIAQYKAALSLNPDFILALVNLTNLLARDGELDEALRYGEKAMMINPSIDKVHSNLGEIYNKKGLRDKAEASFKTFLYLNRRAKMGQFGVPEPERGRSAP